MFEASDSKYSEEKLEEFGRLIDHRNNMLFLEKCRKYSLIDSDDQTSVTSNKSTMLSNSKISKTKKIYCKTKPSSYQKENILSNDLNELELNEKDYYFSPLNKDLVGQESTNEKTINKNSVLNCWSNEKKKISPNNPFRKKVLECIDFSVFKDSPTSKDNQIFLNSSINCHKVLENPEQIQYSNTAKPSFKNLDEKPDTPQKFKSFFIDKVQIGSPQEKKTSFIDCFETLRKQSIMKKERTLTRETLQNP